MFKKILFFALLSSMASLTVQAQKLINRPGKPDLKLNVQLEDGTNGGAVAYDPSRKLYYASVAGNEEFPLEVFGERGGKSVFQTSTMYDCRGLWYNPKTNTIEGNGYSETGVFSYSRDDKGYPIGSSIELNGSNQPDPQSVGTYDPKKKMILYLYDGKVVKYARKNGKESGSVTLKLEDANTSLDELSPYTLFYTGKKGFEYGIFDYSNNKVLFFSAKGDYKGAVEVPDKVETYGMFNIGYANDRVFFFNQETRVWTGYKVFE